MGKGGGWSGIRDTFEAALPVVGNYLLPGSGLVTAPLTEAVGSKGASEMLQSPVGQIANVASGLAGGGFGSSITGIPSAADVGAGWTNAGNAAGGMFGDPTLGTDVSGGINKAMGSVTDTVGNAAKGVGDTLGLTNGNAISQGDGFFGSSGGEAANAAGGGLVNTSTSSAADAGTVASEGGNAIPLKDGFFGSAASSPISTNVGSGTVGTPAIPIPSGGFLGAGGGQPMASQQQAYGSDGSKSGGSGGSSSFLSGALSSLGAGLGKNLIPSLISGAGLGAAALKQGKPLPGENNIKDIAAQEQKQGTLLENYLQTGTLPPGLQAGLDQVYKAGEAQIRSQYARMGMSGSSAEQQDIANLQQKMQSDGAEMALKLMQTGINETGTAAELYKQIMSNALTQDQNLGSAISGFSSALAGGRSA